MSSKKKARHKKVNVAAKKYKESAEKVMALLKSLLEYTGSICEAPEHNAADGVGVGRGSDAPSPAFFIRLGNLASFPENFWFWEQAGMDGKKMVNAVKQILKQQREEQAAPLVGGEVYRIPEFRETATGRESAGAPIPLAARFIPRPEKTICVSVDAQSTGMADSPKGIFILDTSFEGAQDISALWDRVVMLRYAGEFADSTFPQGIYSGRLFLNAQDVRVFQNPQFPRISGWLEGLVGRHGPITMWLGEYTDREGMRGIAPEDEEGRAKRWGEIRRERALNLECATV